MDNFTCFDKQLQLKRAPQHKYIQPPIVEQGLVGHQGGYWGIRVEVVDKQWRWYCLLQLGGRPELQLVAGARRGNTSPWPNTLSFWSV